MPDEKTSICIAAIDVGASAIRMEISEIHENGEPRTVEKLSRAVSLGKDTFTLGLLQEDTIQTACQALTDFSKVMKLYSVSRYRAVATSAVREANNADTFLDRVFLRSGIELEIIDGSEENRLSYMAIYEAAKGKLDFQDLMVLMVEVGGGSTDISFLDKGKPTRSGVFSLGAIRMRQALLGVKTESKSRVKILERQIKNALDTISKNIPFSRAQEVIALGSDIRLAARRISGEAQHEKSWWIIDRKDFQKFCAEVSRYDVDEIVDRLGIGFAQAETLIPALLTYRTIADRTKAERINVVNTSLRDGLLLDLAYSGSHQGPEPFNEQILASARALAQKYASNEAHHEQVKGLALSLFDQLQQEHGLDRKERLFLEIAALLHDVGRFIGDRAHHKHSQYILSSSEIFGLSRQDMHIISNIARYHRKSVPTRSHIDYISLDRESRMVVSKLAAILRIADALDQDYSSRVRAIRVTRDNERSRYILEVEAEGDMTMERIAVENKSDLFRQIYGKPIVLQQVAIMEPV